MNEPVLTIRKLSASLVYLLIHFMAMTFAIGTAATSACADQFPFAEIRRVVQESCVDCHGADNPEGGLDLSGSEFDLSQQTHRQRWILVHDRVVKGEMPPDRQSLADTNRQKLTNLLAAELHQADVQEIAQQGRGPMRRLNRDEYEQNLRDALRLPHLDIRDMLPEDREAAHFDKTAQALDMSHIQLLGYLDAAEAALRQAMVSGPHPPAMQQYRATGTDLFSAAATFGEREAMFFASENKALSGKELESLSAKKADALPQTPAEPSATPVSNHVPAIELALFRSAHWPYFGYPKGFVAKQSGIYRVRFSARAVLQTKGFLLQEARAPVPMTFRARKPSGPDVSGDVRATGGILDILPQTQTFETTVRLLERETIEYSLLGLPVPLARNVNGGPPTYRYPPFPESGQPGVAFQWLEIEGPLSAETWPPPSHQVLFPDDFVELKNEADASVEAKRLLRRFVDQVAREPTDDLVVQQLERLVLSRLHKSARFQEAMLTGYQAFLCSSQFLFLPEPQTASDQFAIASRLSHFLTNSRPDPHLMQLAAEQRLGNAEVLRAEVQRLIASDGFSRFVQNFSNYWLDLRYVRRDDPDVRLYPEYRFDDYLVESMEQETLAFVTAMVRENLPCRSLVDADFIFVNDRLAKHYRLHELMGSSLRKVALPADSPLGGLLTQAAILKVTANGTTTSPVVRGAWIMDRLLGEPPPPPPTAVPAVEPDIRGAKTIRQLLEFHTKIDSCANCHARFDPAGFALENFDVLGGWRTRYRGLEQGEQVTGIDRAGHDFSYTLAEPIDPSGQLLDGRKFADIRELKKHLAANPRQLARNLLHQLTVYATGTPVRFSDRPEIERILDVCQDEDYRVGDLFLALV